MQCEQAREAVSARLDGEPSGLSDAVLDDHLARCPACQGWQEAAHEVTRSARLGAARREGVGADAIVAAVLARSRPPRRPSVLTLVRGALALVGLAQVAIAAPLLLSGHDHAAPEHVAHEMGAFAMALGFGFLLAAWKPDRARGMHGLVGVAAVLLVVTAAVDLAHGRTDFGDEAPHVFAVVGWLLLGWLAVATPSRAAEAGTVSGTRHGGGVRHRRVPAMGASLRLGPRGAAESAPDGERRAG